MASLLLSKMTALTSRRDYVARARTQERLRHYSDKRDASACESPWYRVVLVGRRSAWCRRNVIGGTPDHQVELIA